MILLGLIEWRARKSRSGGGIVGRPAAAAAAVNPAVDRIAQARVLFGTVRDRRNR